MMKKHLIYFILILGIIFCGLIIYKNDKVNSDEIKISWVDNLSGDFSFKEKWDYPEGVYKNEFGQLSCDGLCPPEIDRMKDENGRIYDDSLVAFYQDVDTTHLFHTLQSEACCYEWAGTNFATAKRKNKDTIIFFTHNNISTHSSLNLTITKSKCVPTIVLNSIVNNSTGTKTYYCKVGKIKIDKNLWKKGILKAKFNFTFNHKENPEMKMYWKGKIYANIITNKETPNHDSGM